MYIDEDALRLYASENTMMKFSKGLWDIGITLLSIALTAGAGICREIVGLDYGTARKWATCWRG